MDNLPELRDIHLPNEGVSMFPLAAGWWWLLIAVILIIVAVRLLLWFRRTSKKLYAKYLLNKNAADNNLRSAVYMSELLRRICVGKFPEAVSLSGDKWVDFLNSKTVLKLDEKTALLLNNAPYIPENSALFAEDNVADLRKFCLAFIGANL